MIHAVPSGVVPSAPDARDRRYRGWTWGASALAARPPFVARDQGLVPCCVSMAIVGALEVLLAQRGEPTVLSPLFHYWEASRQGAHRILSPRQGLDAAQRTGVCAWSEHPIGEDPFTARTAEMALEAPSDDARVSAQARTLRRLGLDAFELPVAHRARRMKAALGDGVPVLIVLPLTPAYDAISQAEPVFRPDWRSARDLHMALVVGHEAAHFRVRDSRGAGFGEGGSWFLPEGAVSSGIIGECWVIATRAP